MEKEIKLNKKEEAEFQKKVKFFLEALVHISDKKELYMTTAKLLSRLSCFRKELSK